MSDPLAAVDRRPLGGAVFGVFISAVVLLSIAWAVAGWLALPRHGVGYAVGSLLLFVALEVRVQRARAETFAPIRARLRAIGEALAAPRAGWQRGQPWVGGALASGAACTAHVEWAGGRRHRLVLTVEAGATPELWVYASALDGAPRREAARLRRVDRLRDVTLPDGLAGLAPDPDAVARRWAASPVAADAIAALVHGAAPRSAWLDLRADAVAWHAPFDDVPDARAAIELLGQIEAVPAAWREEAGPTGL